MSQFVRFLLRHRVVSLLLIAVSIVVSGYAARTLQLRFQYRDFYDRPGNPNLAMFEDYHKEFGDTAIYLAVMLEAKDVFAPQVLDYIEGVTNDLKNEPAFRKVLSLSTAQKFRAENDEISSGPILSPVPKTPDALAKAKKQVLESPLIVRRLVSTDGTATMVVAQMAVAPEHSTIPIYQSAIDDVERVLAKRPTPSGVTVHVTGAPVVEVETTRALILDQMKLIPGVLLVLTIGLFLLFRSFQAVLLPLATVTTAMVWMVGVFAQLGHPIDIIGSVMPTTLLVYGVVDPIFVYARYMRKLEAGRSREDAIVESLTELALPCFLTSLSTALGFAAYATTALPMVRYYGIGVAIGVLLAWVTTLTVLPLLLATFSAPKQRTSDQTMARVLDNALNSAWNFVRRHVALVLLSTVAIVIVTGLVSREIHVSNGYVRSLPDGKAYDTVRALESKLTGVVGTVVTLEGEPDTFKRPEVIKAMARVEDYLRKQPDVTSTFSLADVVADANQAFHDGDKASYTVPDSKQLITSYLMLLSPSDRSDYVSVDYSKAHITALSTDNGSEAFRLVRDDIRREVDAAFQGLGVRTNLTGTSVVAYVELDNIAVELVKGFITAFAIIVALQWLLFRSLRIALISVVPNLVPVLVSFAFMRLMGIQFSLESGLVLGISVGGLFNTTIHMAARIQQRLASGDREPDSVVGYAVREIGPPSLFTAAILGTGFAVLLLSSFHGLRVLGFFSMLTLFVGFFSDMLVTSASMRVFFNWQAAIRAAEKLFGTRGQRHSDTNTLTSHGTTGALQ